MCPLPHVSSTMPSFQNIYYMLFSFSVLLFLLSFDMSLSPSSHSCVYACMCAHATVHMYICIYMNSLEYCPFLNNLSASLLWFHLCIFFPKNKSTLFSTFVFSLYLCFLFKTFNNLCECITSKVSTIPQSVSILSFLRNDHSVSNFPFLFYQMCISLHGFLYYAISQFVYEEHLYIHHNSGINIILPTI